MSTSLKTKLNSDSDLQTKLKKEEGEYGKNNTFYYRPSPIADKIKDGKIPLVLVLGWAGSSVRNVSKYSQIYEQFGFHTIKFSPSTHFSMFQSHLHKAHAIQLLDMIKQEKSLDNSPILVHTFSNAGTFIYRYASELIHENTEYAYLKSNFKAIIYDSAPGYTTQYARLFKAVAGLVHPFVKFKLIAYIITLLGFAAVLFNALFSFGKENFFIRNIKALEKDKLEMPVLVFCSKADDLVDYKQTLDFFERRKKHVPSIKIDTVVYEDSEHCMHYIKYRESYLNKLKQLLVEVDIATYEQLM